MAVIRYVTSVYISDIIYNYVGSKYGHGGYLILNGKYGLIQSYGASILPIYDTIPEHITRYITDCGYIDYNTYLVKKDNLYGILEYEENTKEAYGVLRTLLPPIYKKGEIYEISRLRYLINQKGKPMRIYYPKDSTYITIHTADDEPVISYGGDGLKYYIGDFRYEALRKSTNVYDSTILVRTIFTYITEIDNKYIVEKKMD